MNLMRSTSFRVLSVSVLLLGVISSSAIYADDTDQVATYRVIIQNLTYGQPFSPSVGATHSRKITLFQPGTLASPQLEALAENGDPTPMFRLLQETAQVTDAVNVGQPLAPTGQVIGTGFTDSTAFEIQARPGDLFSMVAMFACTNDGFVGLSRARLPERGFVRYWARSYDAGTENNTEKSRDIVDQCSTLESVSLAGNRNGNENAEVDTDPQKPISKHAGILGVGDLSRSVHRWVDPAAVVFIVRIE